MTLTKVYDAATAFKYLNGIINVFKPAGRKASHVRIAIIHNLCRDLNQLEVREPRKMEMLEPGGDQGPVVRKVADLSDHILSVGPRYQMQDIKCAPVSKVGFHTSGVLLFGINRGLKQSSKIHMNRPVRVYHVKGCLGTATETHFYDSRVTVKSKFNHVHPDRMSGMVSSLQASHQRKMYELCGVDLQSQAAYEMASKGIIRPASNSQPVLYGIKLIDFNRPEFTLEVAAINENEDYLATLIHEIGIELRTVAHCTAIRCIRHGHFGIEDSLLRNSWDLASIFENMRKTRKILEDHPQMLNQPNVELRVDS
ncbi:pseudouridylate synthase TRUB2, mitochondrial [Episyrphus balteatus]|uniref:pseudouridylate synthase TRUB2, mitochondrial n=1 Tax=Episyrphus balteatus TaxID=286459 RepID=UPI0024853BE9|nr:pseudouridylate synthase TRUB2, mitochondrial [Episyrphus balteatus]